MEDKYRIIEYAVANVNTNEMCHFNLVKHQWEEARNSAIAKAMFWKEQSELEEKHQGIQLWMRYGIEANPDHVFMINLLTGDRMHSPEITQALWDEATALDFMGYLYDATTLEDENGVSSNVVTESHITLFYFTA